MPDQLERNGKLICIVVIAQTISSLLGGMVKLYPGIVLVLFVTEYYRYFLKSKTVQKDSVYSNVLKVRFKAMGILLAATMLSGMVMFVLKVWL